MGKKIKQFLVKIYNYICLFFFKPSHVKYRCLESRRHRDANKKILQNFENYTANGLSFEELIPLICKQYSLHDALHMLSTYFDILTPSVDQNENRFCGVHFYFKFGKFTKPFDQKTLALHEQRFDLWTVEKSDLTFELHLLIKCAYYESIDRPLKSMRLLQHNLKRDDPNLELILLKKYIEYENNFFGDEVIEYFLNARIIDKCLDNCDDAGHEIVLLYLTSLIRRDDLDKFFIIYKKISLTFDLPRHTDIQRKFELQLTEACINSFQFKKARDLNGLLKYSIHADGYLRNWRAMAQTNFFLGNNFRSKAYFTLTLCCFGLSGLSGADMKILLGITYNPFNALKQAFTRFARKQFVCDTKISVLAQSARQPSIDSWSRVTATNHLKSLFDKGDYQQAAHYYEQTIQQLPKNLLRGTFLPRRVEGLKKNNVIAYLNTYRRHITTTSLLHNLPNFETTLTPDNGNSILVLAHFGPGDEFMASSSYPKLITWAKKYSLNISIATQRRLIPIMQRTFPEIGFIENDRTIQGVLNHASVDPSILKEHLASTNLLSYTLDAETQKSLSQYAQISSTQLICSQFHESHSSRKLKTDPKLMRRWKEKLRGIKPQGTRLVGISWRSSLVTKNRIVYYPDLSELLILEDLENVIFVNLQVNLTNRERLFFKKSNFKFIDFPDLCLSNDFDGVASLICNLDATISPITTMGALSSALYVPTILLSPTLDTMWRLDDNERDLIYGENVKVAFARNNNSCIEAARDELVRKLTSCSHQNM